MADDGREFCTSQMVKLELLPKPLFEKRKLEVAFYQEHFEGCVGSEPLSEVLGNEAEQIAAKYGLAGPDALQISAALRQGAGEFYTSEKPGRPMFRVRELKVISLLELLD